MPLLAIPVKHWENNWSFQDTIKIEHHPLHIKINKLLRQEQFQGQNYPLVYTILVSKSTHHKLWSTQYILETQFPAVYIEDQLWMSRVSLLLLIIH